MSSFEEGNTFEPYRQKDTPLESAPVDFHGLAALHKLLADEQRLRILLVLSEGDLPNKNILEFFPHSTQPGVSYHLLLLTQAGLLDTWKDSVFQYYGLSSKGRQMYESYLRPLIDRRLAAIDQPTASHHDFDQNAENL